MKSRSFLRVFVQLLMMMMMMMIGGSFRLRPCHAWTPETSRLPWTSFVGSQFRLHIPKRSFVRPSHLRMMPEGPEVRTVVDHLQQGFVGHRLIDLTFLSGRYVRHGRPRGFAEFAATMTPCGPMPRVQQPDATSLASIDIIQEWNAKGKFIYIRLDQGRNPPAYSKGGYQRSIWITLGMSGGFVSESVHLQDPRFARWVLELLDPATGRTQKIFYHDARNFGTLRFSLSLEELQEKLESLGLDILDPENTTVDEFLAIVDRQRPDLNVCKFLMDQSVRKIESSFCTTSFKRRTRSNSLIFVFHRSEIVWNRQLYLVRMSISC